MKNHIYTILLVSLLIFGACSGQLDQYSHSAIPPGSVTVKDLPALRRGVYNSFQNSSGPQTRSYIMFDLLGGSMQGNTGAPKDMINSILSPLNTYIVNAWSGYFYVLYQVNNVIEITESDFSSPEASLARGEALYFRAYIYYCLAACWGDVPIIRDTKATKGPRDPIAKVWEFIETDLDEAIGLLGKSKNYYYVSRDAATALKARVMLSQGKMSEAAELAESLIGTYRLDSFEKIFRKSANTEIIFAFENNPEESSLNISDLFYTYAHTNKGQGVIKPCREIIELFDDFDNRKAISLVNIAGSICVNKYPSGQTGRDPFIVSRVAEMYLISAEAKGRADGISRLNELRVFRGLPAISPAPTTDKEYMDAVMTERRRELMAENFLYYDLVRTGRAIDELDILSYQVLLPIPGKELQLNSNLKPNPGY